MAEDQHDKKRNETLNLSMYSPEEIARRVLQTPPPAEKQDAKEKARRKKRVTNGEETTG